VQPILLGAGGTPFKRVRVTDTVAGSAGTTMALMMDFDTPEAITKAFASDSYQELIADRDKAFSNLEILITEPIE
jgi:uncharacterized protein (DUF1330 family)